MDNFAEELRTQSAAPAPEPMNLPKDWSPWQECPTCQKSSGTVTVGRQEFHFCTAHRVYWKTNFHYMSDPKTTVDERQKAAWIAAGLDDFEEVLGLLKGAVYRPPAVVA